MHVVDDEGKDSPPIDAVARWSELAMRASHSRLSRKLFGVAIDPPRVGRFEIEALQGTGAMGAVFAARDPQLERRVAVKLLTVPDPAAHAERLFAEARALARLSHPNVVTLHEVCVEGNTLFVVMELVDGGPLSRLWSERSPTLRELLDAFVQAGEGLAAVHEAGIVHCDFKPANVLVTPDGRVKVADFGLARLAEVVTTQPASPAQASGHGTSSTTPPGTRPYMAPELRPGGARPSERSDQYSFCVSFWEALHGCRPFPDPRAIVEVLEPRRRRSVPRWLDRALARGLAPEPSARWPTMRELVAVLRNGQQRRRSRPWSVATVLTLPVVLVTGQVLNRGPTCTERGQDLDAVWSGERKGAIDDAWRDGAPFAHESWPVVRDRIDRWAEAWIDVQQQACRATFEVRRRSEVAFDRTMVCLDRRRAALGSATELLASARPELVASAGRMLDALPHPSSCLDDEHTASSRPSTPESTAIARGIDRARLLVAAGDPTAALAELAATSPQLAAEDPSVAAEFHLVRGRASSIAGQWDEAVDDLWLAARTALQQTDDAIAADALVALAEVEVDRQHPVEASRWLERADAEQQRSDAPSRDRAHLRDVAGSIALRRGDAARAEQRHREALALLADADAIDPMAFTVRRHLGVALAEQHRYLDAEAIYTALMRDVETAFGPSHPDLGMIAKDLAIDARARGEPSLALAHARRGHALLTSAFGEDSIRIAPTLTLMADLWSELGEPDKAMLLAQEAWHLQREHLPIGHSERGSALALLAWLRMRAGDFAKALASNLELEREYRDGPNHDQLPTISHGIGYCLCALGRCAEAHERFATLYLRLASDDPLAPYVASGLALAELARGHRERAEELARHTLEHLLAEGNDDTDLHAELRLTVAACRLAAGDRRGTRAMARDAAADGPSLAVRKLFSHEILGLLDGIESPRSR